MNRLKEHKGISLLLRYKKEMLRRMDCLLIWIIITWFYAGIMGIVS